MRARKPAQQYEMTRPLSLDYIVAPKKSPCLARLAHCKLQGSSAVGVAMLVMLFLLFAEAVRAASIDVGQGNRISVRLKSLKDLRDQHVVKQAYDYSCGAAALATLLTYGLRDTATEQDVLIAILTLLTEEEKTLRRKDGLSLLDLQRVAQSRGHKAQGFRLAPKYLARVQGPTIVFIKPHGYEHFAVLKGIRGDRAYLADPSRGNVRMPIYKFLSMWLDETGQGVIFVVEKKGGDAASTDGTASLLHVPQDGVFRPEILTTRQLLEIGNSHVPFPPIPPQ
jgi:uncharacterized protein